MAYTEIGKNIRAARKQLDMSQEELAEKSGLSAKFIGNIERGEKAVSLDSFICIANALGASADALLGNVLVNGYKAKATKRTRRGYHHCHQWADHLHRSDHCRC